MLTLDEFQAFHLRLCTRGGVSDEDIEQNDVKFVKEASHRIPGFVKVHESMLAQKRMVSDEVGSISYPRPYADA